MTFEPLPASAAWRHVDAQDGFETVFFRAAATGYVVDGHTSAVEDGVAWAVHFTIEDELVFDADGLVRDYPGIAERVA